MIDSLLDFEAAHLLDADGRPCGEQASPHYDSLHTELLACPYEDVRRGGAMNASALRQVAAVWPSVLGNAAALAGPEASVFAAFRAAVAGTAAPVAWRRRHPDRPVPRVLSALFKTCLGFSQVLCVLLMTEDGVADSPLAALGDARQFLAYLDGQRWLLGQVQVCAGSPAMISAMFDALCGRARPIPAPELDPGSAWIDGAVAAVGLQLGYVLVLDALAAHGISTAVARGERWRLNPRAPWLRAIGMWPGQAPEHARRLFPDAARPAVIDDMIAAATGDLPLVEARFAQLVRRLEAA